MKVVLAISTAPRSVEQRVLVLAEGARVHDALRQAEIDAVALGMSVGVWGQLRPLDWPLREGDRVELSRALEVHPMEARRRRHEHQQRQHQKERGKP